VQCGAALGADPARRQFIRGYWYEEDRVATTWTKLAASLAWRLEIGSARLLTHPPPQCAHAPPGSMAL
jgi:hypothetical protein